MQPDYTVLPDGTGVVFQDGTRYSITEMLALTCPGTTPADLEVLHAIKKIFDGEILLPGAFPQSPAIYRTNPGKISDMRTPAKPPRRQKPYLKLLNRKKLPTSIDSEQIDLFDEYS